MKHEYVNGTSMIYVGLEALHQVKMASWFPHRTGNLRNNATNIRSDEDGGFTIYFDEEKAPYVNYLEFGTNPHFIPFAFGRNEIVYHPGSDKHWKFIEIRSSKMVAFVVAKLLKGKVQYFVND
jgi:hypothetical protein